MSLKKIKPQESAFNYNPKTGDLVLVSDITFAFNNNSLEFELDQNPQGESNCVPITNIMVNKEYSELKFDAVYRKKETTFNLLSDYECDKLIYRLVESPRSSGYLIQNEDRDKIEIIFIKGVFSKLYVYKHIDRKLVDSLAIVSDNESHYLIKQSPWKKIKLLSIDVNETYIVCIDIEKEEYKFKLDVQLFILELLKSFLRTTIAL